MLYQSLEKADDSCVGLGVLSDDEVEQSIALLDGEEIIRNLRR